MCVCLCGRHLILIEVTALLAYFKYPSQLVFSVFGKLLLQVELYFMASSDPRTASVRDGTERERE